MANSYRGTIFSTSCGGIDELLLSDKFYYVEEDLSERPRISASSAVNDAIDLVFNQESFVDYDCDANGVTCHKEDGYIVIGE